jgi:acetyl-CoA synthetase
MATKMTNENHNLAYACCQRWASDRSRLALYYEDADGISQAYSFWDIQRAANRLSNALGALGTLRGERIAIILPQRPETGIAHIACYQMGAIAVPLSPQLSQANLAQQLVRAEARIALVDKAALPQLWALHAGLPQLRHIIGVDGALESGVHDWDRLLEYASPRYPTQVMTADTPALLIDTGGEPELLAHECLTDRLPGFISDHENYPQTGDMFWSPIAWDTQVGLFGALLPTWNFGQPILGYRGSFDPEKVFWLTARYGVRNLMLHTDMLKSMMEAVPKPKEEYGPELNLRTLVSDSEVDQVLQNWTREELGVNICKARAS